MDFLTEFPSLGRVTLLTFKKTIDGAFREFNRSYGEYIEAFFDPLLWCLKWIDFIFVHMPWPLFFILAAGLAWLGSRSIAIVIGTVFSFALMGMFGMWEETMETVAIVSVSTALCIGLGIPLGIWMARSDRVQGLVTPVLDIMQTVPSFVYLIPIIMLLGIGKVPALIAVFIYAVPPVVRLTNLGIRLVDEEVLEAADSFGASYRQRLWGVQVPLALPNIFAGINQTIMMALAMVVIAAMIGAPGLGRIVLKAVQNQYLASGMMAGLAIVALAIIFDRVSQAYGKRLQKHREGGHGV